MTVVVKKLGGSVAVIIPKAVAHELGFADGTSLDVRTEESTLILRKQHRRPRRPLGPLVAQIKPDPYRRHTAAMTSDTPVGREIW
jgi:antitoxin component of MazEF toxin-antitoxin module